ELSRLAGEIADGLTALAREHRELEIGELRAWLADLLTQIDSLSRDDGPGGEPGDALRQRLRSIARRADAIERAIDFRFLLDPERKVFSIGFNPGIGRLDRSYYDLLVSEARLTSFLAIAKGDAPTEHWFRLARP